jgi:hypothetical protein
MELDVQVREWVYAPDDIHQREKISPNHLVYHKSSETLAVFVKRSHRGGDFALSQGGLNYLLKMLDQGGKDGSPVRSAIVVLTDFDGETFHQWSAEEMRDRFNGVEPVVGKFGPYWWIPASACDDGPW